jgi:hypothetical protein
MRGSETPRNLNPLNAELNPFCYLLALLGNHRIFHLVLDEANISAYF